MEYEVREPTHEENMAVIRDFLANNVREIEGFSIYETLNDEVKKNGQV
jgi:hypothetical protein